MRELSREELHKLCELLREEFKNGTISIPKEIAPSILKLRYASDGLVDVSSIDPLVKGLLLSVANVRGRQTLKKAVSFLDIQETYFSLLEHHFGAFYSAMKERDSDPHSVAQFVVQNAKYEELISRKIPDFLESIREFWVHSQDIITIHAQDNQGIKAVFGGDLAPSYAENICSKCGVYTDTIILSCPFLRISHLFKILKDGSQAYYIVKHALNLLQYKDLALAKLDVPIVAIIGDVSAYDEEHRKSIAEVSKADAL